MDNLMLEGGVRHGGEMVVEAAPTFEEIVAVARMRRPRLTAIRRRRGREGPDGASQLTMAVAETTQAAGSTARGE